MVGNSGKDGERRAPVKASALILAQLDTPNLGKIKKQQEGTNQAVLDWDPLAGF